MRELFEKKVNIILIVIILIVAILVIIPASSRGCVTSTSNGEIVTVPATPDEATEDTATEKPTKPTASEKITNSKVKIKKNNASNTSTDKASTKSDAKKASSKTTSKTKKKTSSQVFATAPKVENKASHSAQWNAGYLIAVDGPDTSYYCGHIELSDKDRELLEKLCMGELGSGGFTGAALIAQAVKNAMYFDGYTSVQAVINNYHYTGRLTTPTQRVKDAVIYVFDMDKDAIQHRILYMYNPELMDDGFSKFHESQRYICTYQDVRFFDR